MNAVEPSSHLRRRLALISILMIFALDSLGATIVYPIFAPLFIEPSEPLIRTAVSLPARTMLLGLFFAIFPLVQFIAAPVVNCYASRYGTKQTLVGTLTLTAIGYLLSAWSLSIHSPAWIFVGRILMGCGAANISVCLNTVAHQATTPSQHRRYLTSISIVTSLAFIVGPFVGGKLADPQVNPRFNLAFPMLCGAALTLVALLWIILFYHITHHRQKTPTALNEICTSLGRVGSMLKIPRMRKLFTACCCYLIGWNILFLFIPALVVERFKFSHSKIGDVCGLLAIAWIAGSTLVYWLFKKVDCPRISFTISILLFSATVLSIPFLMSIEYFVTAMMIATLAAGFAWPACLDRVLGYTPGEQQGPNYDPSDLALTTVCTTTLSIVVAALIGGAFIHSVRPLAFFIASGLTLLSLVLFGSIKHPRSSHSETETAR